MHKKERSKNGCTNQQSISVRNVYEPFTMVPYLVKGAKWCCSCTSGPPKDDTACIICCDICGDTWGHQDCLQITDLKLSKKELEQYHFRCFECRSDKTAYQQLLLKHIDASNSITELVPLLNTVHALNEVKDILRKQVNKMDTVSSRTTALRAMSITDVLPDDALQKILSFHHCSKYSRHKEVSKAFKRCYEKNADLLQRRLMRYQNKIPYHTTL